MICQHCGAETSDNCNFCTYCGATIATQEGTHNLIGTPGYKLDLSKLLEDTFVLYKRNCGTMCLVGLIMFGITLIFILLSVAMTVAAMAIRGAEGFSTLHFVIMGCHQILFPILQNLIQWYIMLGVIRQCLYLARGGVGFQTTMMFPPFMMYLKMVGLMLLFFCIIYGVMLLILLPAGIVCLIAYLAGMFANNDPSVGAIVLIAGAILCCVIGVCAGVWVSIRLYLAQVFIADQDAGIMDSMRYAWRITSGNFWMLLVAVFVLGMCSIVGIVLCVVGIILTIAIGWLGTTLVYLQLTGQPNGLDYAVMRQPMDALNQEPPV